MSTAPTLPTCLTKPLAASSNALAADVERLTRQLQKAMQAIHGGTVRILISHKHAYVMVVVDPERRPEP